MPRPGGAGRREDENFRRTAGRRGIGRGNMERAELERTIREWQGPLSNLSYRILGDEEDAAEATQEVFVRLLRRLRRFDRRRELRPWLYRLATNVVLNYRRSAGARRRREARAAMDLETTRPEPDGVERRETEEAVRRELGRLP